MKVWKLKNNSSLLYGAFILTAANILIRSMGFIYRVLLSRVMGAEGMGVLQLLTPVLFTSISLVASGIPISVSRLVAERKAVDDFLGIRRVLFTALGLVISISILISLLLIINVNWVAFSLLKEPRTRGALLLIFPNIIIIPIAGVLKGYFYGLKNFHRPAFADILEQIIRITIVFTLLPRVSESNISLQVGVTVLGMVAGEIISLLYLNYYYYKSNILPQSRQQPSFFRPLSSILKISIPITGVRLLSSLTTSANAILIPQRLIKSGLSAQESLKIFGVLSGMVLPLLFLPFTFTSALSTVMIPNLSEDIARNNWSQIQNKVSKAILIIVLTAFPCAALMASLAHPIGLLLYREEQVGPLLEVLACLAGIQALQHVLSGILNGLGKQNLSAIFSLTGGAIQIFSTFFLVSQPHLGIRGYVIGFGFSTVVIVLFSFYAVFTTTKLSIKWIDWFIKPGFASLLLASISRLVYYYLVDNGFALISSFSIASLAGAVIFLFTLYVMGSLSFLIKSIFPSLQ